MKFSTVITIFAATVAGSANAAETVGNLRAFKHIAEQMIAAESGSGSGDAPEARTGPVVNQEDLNYRLDWCTYGLTASRKTASRLTTDAVADDIYHCLKNVISEETPEQRNTMNPSACCVLDCGDEASLAFQPVDSDCVGSLPKCRLSLDDCEEPNCDEEEEKEVDGEIEKVKNDECVKEHKEFKKCEKSNKKEQDDYDDCEDQRKRCSRQQKDAEKSLRNIGTAFDACIADPGCGSNRSFDSANGICVSAATSALETA